MKRAAKIICIFSLIILIPLGVQKLIQYQQLPDSITIATGREGGRYLEIAKALGGRIEQDYGVKVKYVESAGSIENIRSVVFKAFRMDVSEIFVVTLAIIDK